MLGGVGFLCMHRNFFMTLSLYLSANNFFLELTCVQISNYFLIKYTLNLMGNGLTFFFIYYFKYI